MCVFLGVDKLYTYYTTILYIYKYDDDDEMFLFLFILVYLALLHFYVVCLFVSSLSSCQHLTSKCLSTLLYYIYIYDDIDV